MRRLLVGIAAIFVGSAPALAEEPRDVPADRAPAPAATPAPEASAERPHEDAAWVRGHVSLRYDLRAATRTVVNRYETDQDLTEDLFAEGGTGSHYRFELSGRLRQDLDGQPSVSRFRDIHDTSRGWDTYWLYTAYVEGLELGPLARIRMGRQFYDEVGVRFDGGLAETAALADAVKLIAYGGIPVHLFQASVRGDWLVGAALDVVALPRTDVRFDYSHVTDFMEDLARQHRWEGVPGGALRDDDRWQATIVHRPIDSLHLLARATTFDGRSSQLEGEAVFQDPDLGLTARAQYQAQLGGGKDLSIQWTPLDETLGRYEPYQQFLVDLRQAIGDHVVVSGGGSVRKLLRKGDEGAFNHEYWRVFGGGELAGWPVEGFTVSLLAEYYRSLTFGRSFQASGELSQEIAKIASVGVGTRYSAFKLDEFLLVERENARSYFAFAQLRPTAFLRFRLSYSYETDDEDRFHVGRCDARFDF